VSGLRKRSLVVSGHRTSVALEAEFWEVLEWMAGARGISLAALVAEVDAGRGPGHALASGLRVAALRAVVTCPGGLGRGDGAE